MKITKIIKDSINYTCYEKFIIFICLLIFSCSKIKNKIIINDTKLLNNLYLTNSENIIYHNDTTLYWDNKNIKTVISNFKLDTLLVLDSINELEKTIYTISYKENNYYENGVLKSSINYYKGYKNGYFYFYNNNGIKIKEEKWKNDSIINLIVYRI